MAVYPFVKAGVLKFIENVAKKKYMIVNPSFSSTSSVMYLPWGCTDMENRYLSHSGDSAVCFHTRIKPRRQITKVGFIIMFNSTRLFTQQTLI